MSSHVNNGGTVRNNRSAIFQNLLVYIPMSLAAVVFFGCLAIEVIGIEVSKENRDWFYGTVGTFSFWLSVLMTGLHGRNYGLGWIKSVLFSFLSFQLVFSNLSVAWANLDAAIFGVGVVASFRSAMFLPLLCVILSRFCKVDTWNLCDWLTPFFFFHHGFVTHACWISGCCAGRSWPWGILNPIIGMTAFPTQPCIILTSMAVAWWGLRYAEKHNYRANGQVFANSLILYGFFRYLIELFSDDIRVFWVLSWIAVCSLAMIAQGLLVRYATKKRYTTP